MKLLNTLIRLLFTLWAYFTFFSLMLVVFFYHIIIVIATKGKGIELLYKSYRPWARIWCKLNGVRLDIKGYENFSKNRSYIFVSNHGSIGDMIIVAAAMNIQYRPLGKVEVTQIPFMGFMFKHTLVTVDRSNPESRKESMDRMRELIKQNISVLILPEGTRNRTNKPLQPFHEGAFRLAIEFQLPIVPMILLHTKRLYPNNSLLMNRSSLGCRFLEPVSTESLTEDNIHELKEKVFKLIEECVIQNEPEFTHLRQSGTN